MSSKSDDDSEFSAPTGATDLLRAWERILAIVLGVVSGSAGGYAVFVTENQAGTAALLLLSIVLCIIGIQGTPLIKFGSGSNSFELERRRRNIEQAIESAKAEDNLDKAAGIAEGAALAQPYIQRPAYYDYILYEQELKTALLRVGYMVTESRLGAEQGFDFTVQKDGKVIDVEAKHYSRPVNASVVYSIVGQASRRFVPVLLVASSPLSVSAQRVIAESENVDFAMWRDRGDDENLAQALERMFSRISQ